MRQLHTLNTFRNGMPSFEDLWRLPDLESLLENMGQRHEGEDEQRRHHGVLPHSVQE